MIVLAMIVGGCALVVVSHLTGRKAEQNAFVWRLERDDEFRRELLERLARMEGFKLVGRE